MKGFLQNNYAKLFVALLIAALVMILWSYGRIDDRYVLTVDGFNLKKVEDVIQISFSTRFHLTICLWTSLKTR